jgi:hypothetical protein
MALERVIDAPLGTLLVFAALLGCGGAPPGTLIGESAHFRLFVSPAVTPPPDLSGTNALVALETEWTDVHTMLEMPDGKITYYWLAAEEIPAACGGSNEGACISETGLQIYSPTLPNAHELNHAYMYLRKQRKPIPFLAEGIAEAIACDAAQPRVVDDVPWPGLVADLAESSRDVSSQAGAFVRYLIRTYGADAFLGYYEQSPEQRDPAAFAANFQSFWNTTMDDAWAAVHTVQPGTYTVGDAKICPCSLSALDPGGSVTNDIARTPYWTLPDPAGKTLALTAPVAESVVVKDCAGIRPALFGDAVLARLDGNEPRYVVGPLDTATLDFYLADDCAGAAPYPFSPLEAGGGGLAVGIPNPTSSATVYVNLASMFTGLLQGGLDEVCSTCVFDQGTCQSIAPGATPMVQGPTYGRMTVSRSVNLPTDVVPNYIEITGQ